MPTYLSFGDSFAPDLAEVVPFLDQWLDPKELSKLKGCALPLARLQFMHSRYFVCKVLEARGMLRGKVLIDRGTLYIKDTSHYFSLSHKDGWIALALGDARLGIDIETRKPRKNASRIAKRFFSDREQQWLWHQEDTHSAFLWLWTRKEALSKKNNTPLLKALRTEVFASQFLSYAHEDVMLSVCSDQAMDEAFFIPRSGQSLDSSVPLARVELGL